MSILPTERTCSTFYLNFHFITAIRHSGRCIFCEMIIALGLRCCLAHTMHQTRRCPWLQSPRVKGTAWSSPGALWAHGPLFICHSTSARAWSDGNAPPALLSVRYVAEPGSLTCLSPSPPRKPAAAAASGLLGAPEEGYLFAGSVCARGFKEGAAEGLPALRLSTSKAPRARARCSPLRRPPPSPRGTLPGAQRGGGGGRGGGWRRRPGGRRRRRTREAAPGTSASRAAGREGEAEPRETGTPGVGAGAKRRGSGGERAGRGPRPGASRGTGRRRRRAPCRSVK